jgi:hypothetical protein
MRTVRAARGARQLVVIAHPVGIQVEGVIGARVAIDCAWVFAWVAIDALVNVTGRRVAARTRRQGWQRQGAVVPQPGVTYGWISRAP